MQFILTLKEAYNNEKYHQLKENGYEVIYVSNILPEMIGVEKEVGSVKELEALDFVYEARQPSEGRLHYVPRLTVENGVATIDINNPVQKKWFEEFKK
jgi:hypothetical protein